VVELEPDGLVGGPGEGRGVGAAEAEGGEALDRVEEVSVGTSFWRQPSMKPSCRLAISTRERWRFIARRKRSAEPALMPATAMQISRICSW